MLVLTLHLQLFLVVLVLSGLYFHKLFYDLFLIRPMEVSVFQKHLELVLKCNLNVICFV